MEKKLKIIICLFFVLVSAAFFLLFRTYMVDQDFLYFTSEEEIPDPFSISTYQ